MVNNLIVDRDAITRLCRTFGVRRLVLFGSALTDRFDEGTSDVDFLVEFTDELENRFDTYFDLKDALEELVGRPVDLVSAGALDNPHFAKSVQRASEELYAA